MWDVVSDPTLFKGPEVSAKEGRELIAQYKRQYSDYIKKGGTRSYGSWIKWKGYGRGLKGGNLSKEMISGLTKMGRLGLSRAIKSDYAK